MKKVIVLAGVFAICTIMALANKMLHTDTYTVDLKQSTLEWKASKITGKHNGTLLLTKGNILNNHGNFSGSFEMNMNSIENTDITDAKMKDKLEKHLKSEDFFDVAHFPVSKFILTSVTPLSSASPEGSTHRVKGDLTIKNKTNELSFDAAITMVPGRIICEGSAIIDRSKFDIRYGSKTFFKNIGDKMIDDEFTLNFHVVAVK